MFIFHKTEVLTVILRCLTGLHSDYFKSYDTKRKYFRFWAFAIFKKDSHLCNVFCLLIEFLNFQARIFFLFYLEFLLILSRSWNRIPFLLHHNRWKSNSFLTCSLKSFSPVFNNLVHIAITVVIYHFRNCKTCNNSIVLKTLNLDKLSI